MSHPREQELREALAWASKLPPVDGPTDVGFWMWVGPDGGVVAIASTLQEARDRAVHNALQQWCVDPETAAVAEVANVVANGVGLRLAGAEEHEHLVAQLVRWLLLPGSETGVHLVKVFDVIRRQASTAVAA